MKKLWIKMLFFFCIGSEQHAMATTPRSSAELASSSPPPKIKIEDSSNLTNLENPRVKEGYQGRRGSTPAALLDSVILEADGSALKYSKTAEDLKIFKMGLEIMQKSHDGGFDLHSICDDPNKLEEFYQFKAEMGQIPVGLSKFFSGINSISGAFRASDYIQSQILDLTKSKEHIQKLRQLIGDLEASEDRDVRRRRIGAMIDSGSVLLTVPSFLLTSNVEDPTWKLASSWVTYAGLGVMSLYQIAPLLRDLISGLQIPRCFGCCCKGKSIERWFHFVLGTLAISDIKADIEEIDRELSTILRQDHADDLFHGFVSTMLEQENLISSKFLLNSLRALSVDRNPLGGQCLQAATTINLEDAAASETSFSSLYHSESSDEEKRKKKSEPHHKAKKSQTSHRR